MNQSCARGRCGFQRKPETRRDAKDDAAHQFQVLKRNLSEIRRLERSWQNQSCQCSMLSCACTEKTETENRMGRKKTIRRRGTLHRKLQRRGVSPDYLLVFTEGRRSSQASGAKLRTRESPKRNAPFTLIQKYRAPCRPGPYLPNPYSQLPPAAREVFVALVSVRSVSPR